MVEDRRRYKEALDQPGALTAALNWYRALFRRPFRGETWVERPVQVPTLLIWGEREAYLGLGLTRGLGRGVPGRRVERLRDASYWVQADAPGRVNRLLTEFLRPEGASV